MALKTLNFKMEESEILDMKTVARVYNMSQTELIKKAIRKYLQKLKSDTFYRRSANIQDASAEETEEILKEIKGLSNSDFKIAYTKQFTV